MSIRHVMGAAAVVLACAQLGACAMLKGSADLVVPRPPRASIREFALDARVSVTRASDRAHVGITWQHDRAGEAIDVFSPLGGQLARLTATPDGAQLETAEHKRVASATLDDLSQQVFGARLPLDGMPQWVLGRSLGAESTVRRDERGRFEYLVESDWRIRYVEYESAAADALPRLIDLERDDVRVRLLIDDWRDVR